MIPITLKELNETSKTYEMGFLFGHEVIISYARIIKDSIPEGFYAYDVRHDDGSEGDPVELSDKPILVNWWGTIITNKKLDIDFDNNDVILKCDDNNYDIDYLETVADAIYEENEQDNYAWNIDGYIDRSKCDDFRDQPYDVPDDRLLPKNIIT